MALGRDPFAGFERMRREIDELFGDVFERSGFAPRRGFSPRVDVYYCGDPPRAVVNVDLAGVGIDEVGLEIRGRQLLISGERLTHESEGRLYQQIEIEQGPFRRVVELGADVDSTQAQATYEDGVLRIDIPLVRQDEAVRRVSIEGRRRPGADGEGDPR
jgi:HSP20 family protein